MGGSEPRGAPHRCGVRPQREITSTPFTARARAAIVVAGIAVALTAGLAPVALAATPDGPTTTTPAPHHRNDHRPRGDKHDPRAPTSAPATSPPTSTPAPPPSDSDVIVADPQARPATAEAATALLTGLANSISVKGKIVTAVVAVPPGVPTAAGDEVSVLFGLGPRQTQRYDPVRGNTFRVDFPAGDGAPRQEKIAISLADFAVGGHFGVVRSVPIEAHYNATISPLRFTLVNDCDFDLAGTLPADSEPEIAWFDDRGTSKAKLSLRAWQTTTIDALGRAPSPMSRPAPACSCRRSRSASWIRTCPSRPSGSGRPPCRSRFRCCPA